MVGTWKRCEAGHDKGTTQCCGNIVPTPAILLQMLQGECSPRLYNNYTTSIRREGWFPI